MVNGRWFFVDFFSKPACNSEKMAYGMSSYGKEFFTNQPKSKGDLNNEKDLPN